MQTYIGYAWQACGNIVLGPANMFSSSTSLNASKSSVKAELHTGPSYLSLTAYLVQTGIAQNVAVVLNPAILANGSNWKIMRKQLLTERTYL